MQNVPSYLNSNQFQTEMLLWTITAFPVMELELETTCTWNRENKKVLLKKEGYINLHERVTCSSHCLINVNGVKRESGSGSENQNDDMDELQAGEDDDDDDDNCDSLHTVTFKVMGVTYSMVAQRLLEKLHMKWADIKGTIDTKLEPEPCNKYVGNAIVVSLKYEQKLENICF